MLVPFEKFEVQSVCQHCTGNVIVVNNQALTITTWTLMVSCGLSHCALTPSAGET